MFNNFSEKLQKRPFRLLFVGLALVSAVLYDVLFWKHAHGLGFLFFVSVYIILFLILIGLARHIEQKWPLLFLIPIIILSADVVLFNNAFVYTAPFFIFILLILFSLLTTLYKPKEHEFYFFQIPFLRKLGAPLFKYISQMFKDLSAGGKEINKEVYKKVFIGILVAVPLIFIFGALFSAADQIFADYINRVLDLDIKPITIWRMLRILLLWMLLSGFFYVIINKAHELGKRDYKARKFDSTIISTVLALLNALFLIFVFIQFKYLFGSYEYVLNNEIVFSEYARKGFFQLAWVVALSAGLFILVYRSFAHHGMTKFLSGMHLLFVVQTGVIAASALKRMNLYQEAYGYTVLRLYVEWFIYFVIALLILAVINILLKWRFKILFHAALIMGLVAVAIVASINVDYKIAHKNIARFVEQNKELDLIYLSELSLDVIPAFEKLAVSEVRDRMTINQIEIMHNIIDSKIKNADVNVSFLDFNLGKERAYDSAVKVNDFFEPDYRRVEELNEEYMQKKYDIARRDIETCDPMYRTALGYRSICHRMLLGDKDIVVAAEFSYDRVGANNLLIYEVVRDAKSNTQDYIFKDSLVLREAQDYSDRNYDYYSYYDEMMNYNYRRIYKYPYFYILSDGSIYEFVPEERIYQYYTLGYNYNTHKYYLNLVKVN